MVGRILRTSHQGRKWYERPGGATGARVPSELVGARSRVTGVACPKYDLLTFDKQSYTRFNRVVSKEPFPQRVYPDKGVVIKEHRPTLVFATICTKGRKP